MPAPAIDYAFLHGGGQGGWVWQETIAALDLQTNGAFGRALALDVPGCGSKRGRPTADLTLQDVANELIADLEGAGMKEVVLVGHSQAGQAMALMVQKRPQLFRRFIHVSCSIPLPGQNVFQMMGSGVHGSNENEVGWPSAQAAQDVSKQYAQMFCTGMDAETVNSFLARLGMDMWPPRTYAFTEWNYADLANVPSTYVICLQDGVLPILWQEKFAERFKSDRRVRIDTGHQAMNTRPHALAEIIRHEVT